MEDIDLFDLGEELESLFGYSHPSTNQVVRYGQIKRTHPVVIAGKFPPRYRLYEWIIYSQVARGETRDLLDAFYLGEIKEWLDDHNIHAIATIPEHAPYVFENPLGIFYLIGFKCDDDALMFKLTYSV